MDNLPLTFTGNRRLAPAFARLHLYQIADRLDVSLHTVASHIKNLYRKLDVHSARAAVWRAVQLRVVINPDLV